MCHMSYVMCHMSPVTWHMKKKYNMVELVAGGSLSKGLTISIFLFFFSFRGASIQFDEKPANVIENNSADEADGEEEGVEDTNTNSLQNEEEEE